MRLCRLAAVLAVALCILSGPALGSEPSPEAEEAFFLGNGLLSEGDPTGALQAYEEALSLDPGFYRVHLYRARAFLALNNTALARDAAAAYGKAVQGPEERDDLAKILGRIDAFEKAADEAAKAPSPSPADEQRRRTGGKNAGPASLDVALGVAGVSAIGGWAVAGVSGAALASRRSTAFDQTVPYGERDQAQRDGQALAPVVVGSVVVGGVASVVTAALGISKATGEQRVAIGLGPTLGPGLSITVTPAPSGRSRR